VECNDCSLRMGDGGAANSFRLGDESRPHAARTKAIRELTLDDIDPPKRHLAIAGQRRTLGEFTRHALVAWLEYRRATWPDTATGTS